MLTIAFDSTALAAGGCICLSTSRRTWRLSASLPVLTVANELSQLVPFSRPLTHVDDVEELFLEMRRAAFATLSVDFKLRVGYYTEPVVVAFCAARKSSAVWPVLAVTVAAAAATALVVARRGRS